MAKNKYEEYGLSPEEIEEQLAHEDIMGIARGEATMPEEEMTEHELARLAMARRGALVDIGQPQAMVQMGQPRYAPESAVQIGQPVAEPEIGPIYQTAGPEIPGATTQMRFPEEAYVKKAQMRFPEEPYFPTEEEIARPQPAVKKRKLPSKKELDKKRKVMEMVYTASGMTPEEARQKAGTEYHQILRRNL